MNTYKVLHKQIFKKGIYSIVPIRMDDRYAIMQWRNEQMYHLRQTAPLTIELQDHYFETVIAALFNLERPGQILFSYLEDNVCIGYGGLVHIDWNNRNAEISFIINTDLEKDSFEFHWTIYLGLIEQVAFNELLLHKIYTYAFDLRPQLYRALESNRYNKEARLKEHCLFNSEFIDVVIHSKLKHQCV